MQQMQHALETIHGTGGQNAAKRAATETKPVPTPAQFKAMVESRLAKLRQRTTKVVDEETVEFIAALKGQEEEILTAIEGENQLRDTFRDGTTDRQAAERRVAEYTALKNEIQGQLRQYAGDPQYAQAYQEASQLMNLRRQAQIAADQIAEDHDLARQGTGDHPKPYGRGTGDVIDRLVESAFSSNFIVKTTEDETATFTWKRQGYRSARPNDPVVSGPAMQLANFVGESQQYWNDQNNEIENRTRRDGVLISFRRESDGKGGQLDSELDLIKDDQNVVRTLTALCAGKGEKVLVRLPDRQGEVLLERVNPGADEAVPLRATNARIADQLFYFTDRNTGERRLKDRVYPIDLTDPTFDGVRPGWFGGAMADQILQEAQSQENWKRAEGLRDISQVKDLITAQGLAYLGEVGTCVIDAHPTFTVKIGNRVQEREFDLTLHVIGLSDDKFQVTAVVPGTVERLDPDKTWLQPAIEAPQPRKLLRDKAEWKEVVKANSWSDRDWQVAREAEQRGAVSVNKVNQNDFFVGPENGKDGPYAIRANARGRFLGNDSVGRPQYEQHAVGFVLQRTESETGDPKVEVIWHDPSRKSAEIAKKVKGKHPLANLPNDLRFILGNVFYLVNRTKDGPKVETPAYLKPVPKAKE